MDIIEVLWHVHFELRKGDGNAAFNFLQEHAASLSMFVSGIVASSNEKRDEKYVL